ncbi:MAG: hypothetical protein PWR13_617 [Archaeoglobi archaeon]|nr:hypothetical protein [Archaeoglobi archaeon]
MKLGSVEEYLRRALEGEAMAAVRYFAFAIKAEEEGNAEAAEAFRTIMMQELWHAKKILEMLGEVEDTRKNLGKAISGERNESTDYYPNAALQARDEGNQEAVDLFEYLAATEKAHMKDFELLLKKMK